MSRQLDWAEQLALLAAKDGLTVLPTRELNAETPAALLDAEITPIERMFVRNTGTMPDYTDEQIGQWTFAIGGWVDKPQSWTLDRLEREHDIVEQVAVLECAGNGRAFIPCNRWKVRLDAKALALGSVLSRVGLGTPQAIARAIRSLWGERWTRRTGQGRLRTTGSVMWTRGAVACVKWTGVRLSHLLEKCEPKPGARYTAHYSDDLKIGGSGPAISRGLPIAKALAPETLVAWKLNGQPIPPLHGGPLRLIAPGYPGSAWQKWLRRIDIRTDEHDGRYMNEYRMDGKIIEEMPVNSMITFPHEDFDATTREQLEVRGFAWSGRAPIREVSISVDGGRNWTVANLAGEVSRFAWRRFDAVVQLRHREDPIEIMACAADESGQAQPLTPRATPGNPIGYCNNAVHRVRVRVGGRMG